MDEVLQGLIFRRAERGDLAAIVELLADDRIGRSREDPGEPLNRRYLEAFDAVDGDPNQLLCVIEHQGQVIGCLQLTFIPGLSRLGQWRGQIESVRVARRYRGCGLGRALFDWAIARCRQRGCGLVQLTTDKTRPEALRFYEELGFVASHHGLKLRL